VNWKQFAEVEIPKRVAEMAALPDLPGQDGE
jgi:hypothetical protein